MMYREEIEKYIAIDCPYIYKTINDDSNKNTNGFVIKKINLNNSMTLEAFFNSKEFQELNENYKSCDLKFYLNQPVPQWYTFNIKQKKIFDKDSNEIIIDDKNKSKYTIRRDIEVIYNQSNNITLRDYIEIIKGNKELYSFLHRVEIDYNNGDVFILFGENDIVVLDCFGNKIEDDDDGFELDKNILRVSLELD